MAVSGGVDSMVLLHFFQRFAHKRYDCTFAAAHLDHGLRAESFAQAESLADYCQQQGIPLLRERRTPRRTHRQSSLEAQARSTRYAWFAQRRQSDGFDAVLTAHHATDQLETALMQWVRGTSVPQGMRPLKHLTFEGVELPVVRPFLSVSRSDLEGYCRHYGLPYWEDRSNQDSGFMRNRLRSQVLPLLRLENPGLESTITEHTLVLQQEQDYLRSSMLAHYSQCVSPRQDYSQAENQHPCQEATFTLHLQPFDLLHIAIQRLLIKEILTDLNAGVWKVFTTRHIEAILHLSVSQNRKALQLPLGVVITKSKQGLVFRRVHAGEVSPDSR